MVARRVLLAVHGWRPWRWRSVQVSSATQQTPNRGGEAAAMQILAEAVKMITEALSKAGPTSASWAKGS